MALVANRRSVMTLFSGPSDVFSHQVRMVLAEKGINVDIIEVDPSEPLQELAEYNPYLTVPILVDRDLSLYRAPIIMEYLDERFPHPPLLPVDPVSRARNRLMMYRIERDLYSKIELIEAGSKLGQKARKELVEDLVAISPFFQQTSFFSSDEISLVDCAFVPLLWRLPKLKIELPNQATALNDYGTRFFKRESFRHSLSRREKDFRG
jgi:RNA polymerase-associated protein